MEANRNTEGTRYEPMEASFGRDVGDVSQTSLQRLLDLLQGEAGTTLADVGIAPRERDELDRISLAAYHESETCLDRMRCMLELLDGYLAGQATPPDEVVIAAIADLRRVLSDYERWHALADNAAYYRDNPDVARSVSRTSQSP
jgi:hypothetical protein